MSSVCLNIIEILNFRHQSSKVRRPIDLLHFIRHPALSTSYVYKFCKQNKLKANPLDARYSIA